jgi:hypothetical protein
MKRLDKNSKLRIIVAGMAGIFPVGGMAWHYLQYVLGLSRLGHDVYYYEDTWTWPYHPVKECNVLSGDYSARFLEQYFRRYAPELSNRWCYLHLHQTPFGMPAHKLVEIAKTADLFINVSGACLIPDHLSPNCVTVFLDTDPGYNQITLSPGFENPSKNEPWYERVSAYDRHFTFGENISAAGCLVPTVGLQWTPTRMPIVIDLWSHLANMLPGNSASWRTIMTWNAFRGTLDYHGTQYRGKDHEFERFIQLPQQLKSRLTVAIGGENAPLERLESCGWQVVDGPGATRTAEAYQEFIARSRGEFSVAKHVYVAMRTGWFSDRSASYLAAGRPVVVQDTGFSRYLPVGLGVMPFSTVEEAREALCEVESDYQRHARAALEIAEAYFNSSKILGALVDNAMGDESCSALESKQVGRGSEPSM